MTPFPGTHAICPPSLPRSRLDLTGESAQFAKSHLDRDIPFLSENLQLSPRRVGYRDAIALPYGARRQLRLAGQEHRLDALGGGWS